ncbi:MAG: hypothetical protein NWE83_03955 [Candidatus Bathyarchaeota archaeon]|nr:hypothetical protein [Candidatus Bathyarchaeota archaeon]
MIPNRTYTTVQEFLTACIAYYKTQYKDQQLGLTPGSNQQLAQFVKKFHQEAGTLTPIVEKQLKILDSKQPLILMTAHQPNLFAYSGVFRKATLLHVVQHELQRALSVPVITFFGIADQDFTDDRWVKTAQLPSVQQRNGTINLLLQLPPKKMVKDVPKPSTDVLDGWKQQIQQWINTINHLNIRAVVTQSNPSSDNRHVVSKRLSDRFEALWSLVLTAHDRSTCHADFNAFFMSQIINHIWRYDTLFSRFSDCQQIFTKEFAFLCQKHGEYHQALHKIQGQHDGINDNSGASLAPFWYHCECGGKARLYLNQQNTLLRAEGECITCTKQYFIDLGSLHHPKLQEIQSKISARAIPMALIFFTGLDVMGYIGGVGGRQYLSEAQQIATALELSFPPVTDWRPHDHYLGIGQLEAQLEGKRLREQYNESSLSGASHHIKDVITNKNAEITIHDQKKQGLIEKLRTEKGQKQEVLASIKEVAALSTRLKRECNLLNLELTIINNISTIDSLYPSIIDYAINIGLPETSIQWINHLVHNQSLTADVYMKSLWEE